MVMYPEFEQVIEYFLVGDVGSALAGLLFGFGVVKIISLFLEINPSPSILAINSTISIDTGEDDEQEQEQELIQRTGSQTHLDDRCQYCGRRTTGDDLCQSCGAPQCQ